jgi:hypothetical protein
MARPETPSTSVATEILLDAGVLQGLLDALDLGGVGLDQPLAVAGQVAQLAEAGGATKLPRSSPHSEQLTQPGGITDVGLAAGQDPGRGGRPASSSWNPRSSSTYQQGFQSWPVASITTWVTPSVCSQSARVSRLEVNVG